jgi:hypothetical protein
VDEKSPLCSYPRVGAVASSGNIAARAQLQHLPPVLLPDTGDGGLAHSGRRG